MRTVQVTAGDGATLPLYEALPSGKAKAAVIVIQEAFGVNSHIKDVARRFAAEGYRAVAPHMFHRTGDPVIGYLDRKEILPHFNAITEPGLVTDLEATIAYLSDAGYSSNQVGVVGFCMGGTITLFGAVRYPLGAAVTFYGGGIGSGRFGLPSQVEMAPQLKAPWLGLYGDLDETISVEEVESLKKAASIASVATDVVRYPNADHGFHCDERDSYQEDAAKDAWRRTLAWFDRYLVNVA